MENQRIGDINIAKPFISKSATKIIAMMRPIISQAIGLTIPDALAALD
jgi:hypothetical protein